MHTMIGNRCVQSVCVVTNGNQTNCFMLNLFYLAGKEVSDDWNSREIQFSMFPAEDSE